jgi:beta-lactamase class A
MRNIVVVVAVAVMAAGVRMHAAEDLPALPSPVPDTSWQSLYEAGDPKLQAALEGALNANQEWRSLIRKKKMAVGVVDLSAVDEPRFARVNGSVMMYAASMPKIAILLAVYQSFEDGSLEETDEIHADLAAMIRTSSNAAATRMIDLVGFDKIEQVLTDPRYELYDPDHGGGIWVGKRYAKTGKRVGDPIANISHGATATQACRFYYLLVTGRIISPERSRQMLDDLSDPGLHHKFVSVLEKRAPGARLFRKSGSWKQWHSDSILVWGPVWRRYILVAMVESASGETIMRQLVPVVEGLLHPQATPTPSPPRVSALESAAGG